MLKAMLAQLGPDERSACIGCIGTVLASLISSLVAFLVGIIAAVAVLTTGYLEFLGSQPSKELSITPSGWHPDEVSVYVNDIVQIQNNFGAKCLLAIDGLVVGEVRDGGHFQVVPKSAGSQVLSCYGIEGSTTLTALDTTSQPAATMTRVPPKSTSPPQRSPTLQPSATRTPARVRQSPSTIALPTSPADSPTPPVNSPAPSPDEEDSTPLLPDTPGPPPSLTDLPIVVPRPDTPGPPPSITDLP